MNNWEFIINSAGEPLRSKLKLNGEDFLARSASVEVGLEGTFLNIKVPIVSSHNTLTITKDEQKIEPDVQTLVATTEGEPSSKTEVKED